MSKSKRAGFKAALASAAAAFSARLPKSINMDFTPAGAPTRWPGLARKVYHCKNKQTRWKRKGGRLVIDGHDRY